MSGCPVKVKRHNEEWGKKQRVTVKVLKQSLELVNISFHRSTICKSLYSQNVNFPEELAALKNKTNQKNMQHYAYYKKGATYQHEN